MIRLKSGEKYYVQLNISVHLGKKEVEEALNRVERIKGKAKPIVYRKPIKEFSQLT